MEKSLQDRIDYLISIKAVPSGFTPEQPDPSFPYSGDLYSARTLTLLKKIECSLLSEIEEWLEANNHSGRFYLYPENKRAAQGIKIILELEPSEKETPHQESSSENLSIKVVKLELKNEFLEKENKNLSETVQKLNQDLQDVRAKSSEISVFDQFVKLRSLEISETAKGRGEAAGIQTILETFKEGRTLGSDSANELVTVYRKQIEKLEEEKRDLLTSCEAEKATLQEEIDRLEEELDEYRKRVGELPPAPQEDDITSNVAKTVLEIGREYFLNRKNEQHPAQQPSLPAKTKGPAPMSLEKKLIPVIIKLWATPKLSFQEVAKEVIPVISGESTILSLIKTMPPDIIADFIAGKIQEMKVFPTLQDADLPGLKADLISLATEIKKVLK